MQLLYFNSTIIFDSQIFYFLCKFCRTQKIKKKTRSMKNRDFITDCCPDFVYSSSFETVSALHNVGKMNSRST